MMHRQAQALSTLAVVATLALAAGCANSPYRHSEPGSTATGRAPIPSSASPPPVAFSLSSARLAITDLAAQMVGVPYRYGGTAPREGFDCSGLVFYTYANNGFDVPRNSRQLFRAARKISLDDAAAADLVFFQDQQNLSHVGIYLGDGRFVHAPSSGRTVSISSLDSPYYRRHLVGVGRLLPD